MDGDALLLIALLVCPAVALLAWLALDER